MQKPTFIDLFSGCGGLACGLRQAGLESAWAVEVDRDAAATYEANFGHDVYCGPIESIETIDQIPERARHADVIVGGPPCQGFSPLGRFSPRDAHAQMNELWQHFMRIVDLVDPQVFLVENVPQFVRSAEGLDALRVARSMGYEAEAYVLNAVDYGVPQRRVRGFILATKIGVPGPPQANGVRRTVRDAIGNLPEVPTGRDWHLARKPRPQSIERYRVVPEGGNRFDLMRRRPDITPRCWLEKPNGSTDVFGRLAWSQPALTIRTEFYKPERDAIFIRRPTGRSRTGKPCDSKPSPTTSSGPARGFRSPARWAMPFRPSWRATGDSRSSTYWRVGSRPPRRLPAASCAARSICDTCMPEPHSAVEPPDVAAQARRSPPPKRRDPRRPDRRSGQLSTLPQPPRLRTCG